MNQAIDERLRIGTNPFENAFIRTPWDQEFIDVASINDQASDAIVRKTEEVRESGLSTGMLLLGEPGFGKSHILARLRRLDQPGKILTFVEPPPSPERVLRHILREAVVRLGTARGNGPSPLERLASTFVLKLASDAVREGAPDLAKTLEKGSQDINTLPDFQAVIEPHIGNLQNYAIATDPDLDADVLRAFFFLVHQKRDLRVLGMRWLRGDVLAEGDLARLGFTPTASGAEPHPGEEHARKTLRQMLKVTRAAGKVLVLCVDQIEEVNDGAHPEGTGIRALGEALSNLIQYENSLLVLTACLRERWEVFASKYLNGSQRDRVAQSTLTLKPLEFQQAQAIVQSRLDDWEGSADGGIDAARIFDLDAFKVWMENEVVVHPRAVIQHCARLIEDFRDGAAGLPLGGAGVEASPLRRHLGAEMEEALKLRTKVRHLPGSSMVDGPARIEPPIQKPVRDRLQPNLSLDPIGWYLGTFEQTVRDLQRDPARDVRNADEHDLALLLHEVLEVLMHKGAKLGGGNITSLKLGHYLKDRRYQGNCLEITVNKLAGAEPRGIVFSSADHFQTIRALLERTLLAVQRTPGFFIRTTPLRNTYRKSRALMDQMPKGAAFNMEPDDYYQLLGAQRLRHAAAAGDLSMGPKVVNRDEVDSLLVRSGVLEDNHLIRAAYHAVPTPKPKIEGLRRARR